MAPGLRSGLPPLRSHHRHFRPAHALRHPRHRRRQSGRGHHAVRFLLPLRALQGLLAHSPPRNRLPPPMDDPDLLDRPRSSHHPSHSRHLLRYLPPLPPHPARILRHRLLDRFHPPPHRRRILDPRHSKRVRSGPCRGGAPLNQPMLHTNPATRSIQYRSRMVAFLPTIKCLTLSYLCAIVPAWWTGTSKAQPLRETRFSPACGRIGLTSLESALPKNTPLTPL